MSPGAIWSRRTFLSNAALLSASALTAGRLWARRLKVSGATRQSLLVCAVSRLPHDEFPWRVTAHAVQGGTWRTLARVAYVDPIGAVAVHPHHNVIYVAHDNEEYLGLPAATVSALAVNASTGEFVQLSREALTLSAIRPRHLAISFDGNVLLVAATGGGAYNALSLAADGSILPHKRAIKLTGGGPHPLQSAALPVFSSFVGAGHAAYACDFGSDRVDQLRVLDGIPSIESRLDVQAGSGPFHLAAHPSQELLAVVGYLLPVLTIIETDAQSAQLGGIRQQLSLDGASLVGVSFSDSGRELLVTGTTDAGEQIAFTFDVDPISLTVRQTARRIVRPTAGRNDSSPDSWMAVGRSESEVADWRRKFSQMYIPGRTASLASPAASQCSHTSLYGRLRVHRVESIGSNEPQLSIDVTALSR